MELLCNPSQAEVLALNVNDNVNFLHLSANKMKTGVLTKEDFTMALAPLPSLPLQVDAYNITCMSWCSYGGSHGADALALALANGRVMLLRPNSILGNMHVDSVLLYQTPKPCSSLAWNKAQPELLAMGIERSRTDNSLLIWDVSSTHTSCNVFSNASETPKLAQKPQLEACFAEAVNSIMWTKNEAKTLIAGVSSKYIRMYDLRNFRSPSNVISTKATCGLCQDPCLDTRFASFFENQIYIWDLRKFSKPAAVIPTKFNIVKAEWCPTRKGLLATISSGSSDGQIVRVYDLSPTMVTDSDTDFAYRHVEQIVKLNLGADDRNISSFAWRHDSKNHLIAVGSDGTLHCVNVPERISIGWTKHSRLVSACKQLHQCFDLQVASTDASASYLRQFQIEQIMHARARNGYGMREDVENSDPSINLEPDNVALHTFWKWVKMAKGSFPVGTGQEIKLPKMNSMTLKGSHRNSAKNAVLSSRFSGLHNELKQSSSSSQLFTWTGVPNTQHTIYSSQERSRALKMCSWISIEELRINNAELRKPLLESTETERAAAIALWHLDMQLAIEILQQSGIGDGAIQHSVIAMALSGYTGNGASPLWQEMCKNMQEGLPSPYLRAAFAFLSVKGDGKASYKAILQSREISVLDRIGFMCMYLADGPLIEVMEDLAEDAAIAGNLEGIVATGLTTERGIKLMQSYVDRTKDVQTPALALIQTGTNETMEDRNVLHIIEGYRSLLNTWMLWKERALVDNAAGNLLSTQLKRQGVSIQCNFCGKSVKHSSRTPAFRGRSGIASHIPQGMRVKPTSCPHCRKPLPRCSSCCIYLGTPQAALDENFDYHKDNYNSNLDHWFTWCPSCKHGGHTDHLTLWFNEHTDCPVSGCPCKCWNEKT